MLNNYINILCDFSGNYKIIYSFNIGVHIIYNFKFSKCNIICNRTCSYNYDSSHLCKIKAATFWKLASKYEIVIIMRAICK